MHYCAIDIPIYILHLFCYANVCVCVCLIIKMGRGWISSNVFAILSLDPSIYPTIHLSNHSLLLNHINRIFSSFDGLSTFNSFFLLSIRHTILGPVSQNVLLTTDNNAGYTLPKSLKSIGRAVRIYWNGMLALIIDKKFHQTGPRSFMNLYLRQSTSSDESWHWLVPSHTNWSSIQWPLSHWNWLGK